MKPAASLIPDRTPVAVEPRRPLTRAQFAQLLLNQGGRCGCGCGQKLDPMGEGVQDEHVLALTLGGPNDLANRSIWRKPCSAEKNRRDRSADAKVKRLRGETCAGPKRPIPGRGFGPRSRKMNGDVGLTKKAQGERRGEA